MARHLSLADAVAELVHDGDTVALEGFTHLIPFAAGHEIIRQGRRDLTLVRMTPDLVYDQLIGAGLRPQAGLLLGRQPRRRLAAPLPRRGPEPAGRAPLEIEEHSHAGMANRYVAGAGRAAVRGPARLHRHRPADAHRHDPHRSTCPFTGETLAAVPGAQPRRRDHPRAAGRPGRQRAAVGHHRRAEGGRAGRRAARSSPSRRSSTSSSRAVRRGRAARLGGHRRGRGARRRAPVLRRGLLRARQRRLPARGTRSAATATPSSSGWASTCARRGGAGMSAASDATTGPPTR